MSCPTCSHTMQSIAESQGDPVFWCPRCGTVKIDVAQRSGPARAEQHVPVLVDRCRRFAEMDHHSESATEFRAGWHRIGIEESINAPENRP